MAKLSPALIKRISMALRFQYDQITHEPLPDRWVELIKYLDEKEKRRRPVRHDQEQLEPGQSG